MKKKHQLIIFIVIIFICFGMIASGMFFGINPLIYAGLILAGCATVAYNIISVISVFKKPKSSEKTTRGGKHNLMPDPPKVDNTAAENGLPQDVFTSGSNMDDLSVDDLKRNAREFKESIIKDKPHGIKDVLGLVAAGIF